MLAIERAGVLHLIDPRGVHMSFRAADLLPMTPRMPRWLWLAGTVGQTTLMLCLFAMALAHVTVVVAARIQARSSSKGSPGFATWLNLAAISLMAGVLYVAWTAAS
jgi:hypothetical protein